MRVVRRLALAAALFGVLPGGLHAQSGRPHEPAPVAPPGVQTDQAKQAASGRLARWLELQNATVSLRYRYVDNSDRLVTTKQLQHREALRARVKFDRGGRYAVTFGIFTGVRFTSGWDNTRWGKSDAQAHLSFKALYVAAEPLRGVEMQLGGLYIVKGESTEVTSYDEDGYIMGERLTIRRPEEMFFDEINVTSAYFVGGTTDEHLSVRRRFPHIGHQNYQHYLVAKEIGGRAAVSADYTVESGRSTWRQALRLDTAELRVVDGVLFENYQRTTGARAYGFALTFSKALGEHVELDAGYARIDPDYGPLNADRFGIGNRAFAMATYAFSREFTASFFITRAVGENGRLPQRTLSNTVFTFNALPALERTGIF